jgi:hypothetical protein
VFKELDYVLPDAVGKAVGRWDKIDAMSMLAAASLCTAHTPA